MSDGSSFFLPETITWVSSAYGTTRASAVNSERSFANTVKRRGPKADPWKTPIVLGSGGETLTVPERSRRDTLWV